MVRVRLLHVDDFDAGDYEQFRAMTSGEKRARIDRFRFEADRRRSLLGDALARTMLAEVTGIAADALIFRTDEYGKPYAENAPGSFFNISHSGNCVACIVADEPCGIDVEEIGEVDDDVAENFYTAGEKLILADGPAERFYEIWTVKEAYSKRDGRGLGLDSRSYEAVRGEDGYAVFAGGEKVGKAFVANLEGRYIVACIPAPDGEIEVGVVL